MKKIAAYIALGVVLGVLAVVVLMPGQPGGNKLKEVVRELESAIRRHQNKANATGDDGSGDSMPSPRSEV